MKKCIVAIDYHTHTQADHFKVVAVIDNNPELLAQTIEEHARRVEEEIERDNLFGGCDARKYVDIIDGREVYGNGVVFVDPMGQQAINICAYDEGTMLTIIMYVCDKYGEISTANKHMKVFTPKEDTGWCKCFEDNGTDFEYHLVQIKRRPENSSMRPRFHFNIYDAEFIVRKVGENNEHTFYVESIEADLDWALLYMAYSACRDLYVVDK